MTKQENRPCRVCGLPLRTANPRALAHPECKNKDRIQRYREKRAAEAGVSWKTCCKCGALKPLYSFRKNKNSPDCVSDTCRSCEQVAAMHRERPAPAWNMPPWSNSCGIDWRDANYNPLG